MKKDTKRTLWMLVVLGLILGTIFAFRSESSDVDIVGRSQWFQERLEYTDLRVGRKSKRGVALRFRNPAQHWRPFIRPCGNHVAGELQTIESLCRATQASAGINLSYFGHAFNRAETGDLLGQLVSNGKMISSINTEDGRPGALGFTADGRFLMSAQLRPEITLEGPDAHRWERVEINAFEWGAKTDAIVWNRQVGPWPQAQKETKLVWAEAAGDDAEIEINRWNTFVIREIAPPRAFKEREIAVFFPNATSMPPINGTLRLRILFPETWRNCKHIGECGPIVYEGGEQTLPSSWSSTETVIAFGDDHNGDWIVLAVEDCTREELLEASRTLNPRNLALLDGGTSASVVFGGYQVFGVYKNVGSGMLFYPADKD